MEMIRVNYSNYATSAVLISLLSGCSTVSDQQKLRWLETTPVCFSKPDCDIKWAASREWVQNNSGYKIQIYSDDLIETYTPQPYGTQIAASVTRNPLFITKGDESYSIKIRVKCASKFGCIPSVDESVISFNRYVSNAASNDPACYRNMFDDDKPHLGFKPMWSKESNRYVVKRVCSGSPAEEAGLKPNDILLRIGNVDITEEEYLKNTDFKFGEAVTLEILRGDARHVMEARFTTHEEFMALKQDSVKNKTTPASPLITEERLESLSRMLQKGTITQQEYEARKKYLLEEM
jgi:hypothetical protein